MEKILTGIATGVLGLFIVGAFLYALIVGGY